MTTRATPGTATATRTGIARATAVERTTATRRAENGGTPMMTVAMIKLSLLDVQ